MAFTPRFLKHRGITVIQKLDPSLPRLRRGKVGIVLAGGAVAGGAFKAGGLRALDEALVRRRIPGGSRARLRAQRVRRLRRPLGRQRAGVGALGRHRPRRDLPHPRAAPATSTRPSSPGTSCARTSRELARACRACVCDKEQELFTNWLSGATDTAHRRPLHARHHAAQDGRRPLRASCPPGLFDPRALEALPAPQHGARRHPPTTSPPPSAQTGKALYLTATDLNRGEIVVFGHDEPYGKVPISTAIAASCAIPLWYKPDARRQPARRRARRARSPRPRRRRPHAHRQRARRRREGLRAGHLLQPVHAHPLRPRRPQPLRARPADDRCRSRCAR